MRQKIIQADFFALLSSLDPNKYFSIILIHPNFILLYYTRTGGGVFPKFFSQGVFWLYPLAHLGFEAKILYGETEFISDSFFRRLLEGCLNRHRQCPKFPEVYLIQVGILKRKCSSFDRKFHF